MIEREKIRLTSQVATGLFILFFPGFYYWHFTYAWSGLPFIIGFFGEVAIASLLAAIIFFSQIGQVMKHSLAISSLFVLLMTYCVIWTLMGITFEMPANLPDGAIRQILALLSAWLALFFVGMFTDVSGPKVHAVLWVSWVGMVLITLSFIDLRHLIVNPSALFDKYPVTYQEFTRSVMVVSVALLVCLKKDSVRILFAALACAVVFTYGARSELYGFIFAVGSYELLRCINRPSLLITIFIASAALLLLIVLNFDSLSASRQFNVFHLSDDQSWNERESQSSFAVTQIIEHPFLGVFAGHFEAGGIGRYAHNLLSSWVSFGLIGFLIYLCINLASFVYCLNGVIRKEPSNQWIFAYYLNASSLILIISAKPVFWVMTALAWGAVVNARWHDHLTLENELADDQPLPHPTVLPAHPLDRPVLTSSTHEPNE